MKKVMVPIEHSSCAYVNIVFYRTVAIVDDDFFCSSYIEELKTGPV